MAIGSICFATSRQKTDYLRLRKCHASSNRLIDLLNGIQLRARIYIMQISIHIVNKVALNEDTDVGLMTRENPYHFNS